MSYLLINGDARRIPIADGSVHCCVTSPPYFALRDYGVPGQIGLERTPDEFVAAMVRVFREVRRVLHPTGTVWCNLGDSYAGSWGNQGRKEERGGQRPVNGPRFQPMDDRHVDRGSNTGTITQDGLKPKDLIGIPWRVALALQADGWYLRSDIIWAKPNPMPESVTDRPTKSHEYLFMLAKSEKYFFDAEAVRENSTERPSGNKKPVTAREAGCPISGGNGFHSIPYQPDGTGRNMRSVLTIPTEAFPGSHFATYPRKLVEPCIRAGTSEKGCCPECGAPWEREVERDQVRPVDYNGKMLAEDPQFSGRRMLANTRARRLAGGPHDNPFPASKTLGWHPTCNHGHEPRPCVVFDPFIGSGTTIVVANALGRRGIGLDLSREYLGMARRRIERPHGPVLRPAREEFHPLFAER